MTIQHTPGPWTLHETVRGIRIEDSKTTVCSVFPRGDKEANARLIAAAPDLLEALKALMVSIECAGQEKCIEDNNPLCISTARAAISRATNTTGGK